MDIELCYFRIWFLNTTSNYLIWFLSPVAKIETALGKKLALLGVIIGVVSASLASDEITLLQAQTQEQKDFARFEVEIISLFFI